MRVPCHELPAVGNDLVALPPASSRYREDRWRQRICVASELRWCEEQESPPLAGLRLWAAKEAAYKCSRQRGALRRFAPKDIVIHPNEDGTFAWRDTSTNDQGEGDCIRDSAYLHALAITGAKLDASIVVDILHCSHLSRSEQSTTGKKLLLQLIERYFPTRGLERRVLSNPAQAPVVKEGRHTLPIVASLSHDGPWVAAALKLLPHDSPS